MMHNLNKGWIDEHEDCTSMHWVMHAFSLWAQSPKVLSLEEKEQELRSARDEALWPVVNNDKI